MSMKISEKDSEKDDEPIGEIPVFEGGERTLFVIQINYLNELLDSYKLKCDELEQEKKRFDYRYNAVEQDKKDIVAYSKHALLEKERELEELTEKLENQRQAASDERVALKLELDQNRQKFEEQMREENKVKKTLETRLELVEEFERQREQMLKDMESLHEQLSLQEERHKGEIHNVEMKVLLEKERLQKDVENHKEAQAEHVQNMVEQQLPRVTRQVLRENVDLKTDIGHLKERTAGWMSENDELKNKNRQLRMKVENLEGLLKEQARMSCFHKKVVEQMKEKNRQLQEELDASQKKRKELQSERKLRVEGLEKLRQEQAALTHRCSQQSAELSRQEAELQVERKAKAFIDGIVQDATVSLRKALMDAPDVENLDSDMGQWKQLMEKILVMLDSHTFEAADGAAPLGPKSSFLFQLARYRPGDLGYVPAPATKHIHFRRRTGHVLPLFRAASLDPSSRFPFHLNRKQSGDIGYIPHPADKHISPRTERGNIPDTARELADRRMSAP